MNDVYMTFFRVAQAIDTSSLPKRAANEALINTAMSIVLGIVGVIAIIMVIIGGIQYASSQGDPQSTSRAKQTILYAIIGLILAIFARVLVGLVYERIL